MSRRRTEPGVIPREAKLCGLVWRQVSRAAKSRVRMMTMIPAAIQNNTWLNLSYRRQ